ncbi:MAG TPA: hypothetical protein VHT92_00720 [Candidatus Cybelea sp.]|nr:hypothetical protein [Candidatus Cybelea sp.]
MKPTGLAKYAALVALALCSACGGGSPGAVPTAAFNATYVGKMLYINGRPVTAARLGAPLRYTQIVPEHHLASKHYEFVFNDYGSYAAIFHYPKTTKLVGEIAGDGGQGCTNVLYGYGKKIFWNIGGPTQITEYQVPKTPIKTLSFPYSFPTSCAMNTSGDLAVGTFFESGPGGGDVVIFKNASGSGKIYSTPLEAEYFDGYDPQGNLFADGITSSGYFGLVELPKGGSAFKTITTSNSVQFPGSVQWDGTYVTVFDQLASATYRYTISGTKATLKGTITYSAGDCAQTWIVKGILYCGDAGNDDGGVYNYPGGGSAIATLGSGLPEPLGVTAANK